VLSSVDWYAVVSCSIITRSLIVRCCELLCVV